MNSEQQGAYEHIDVAPPHTEGLCDTQKVKSRKGHCHRQPHLPSGLLPQKHAEHRHQDDVEGGHKPCLPRRGVLDADLLHTAGREQGQSAAESSRNQGLCAPLFPGCPFVDLPQDIDAGEKRHAADEGSDAVKPEGAQVVHSHALGDKGGSPDKRCQKQHTRVFSPHIFSFIPLSEFSSV